MTINEDKLRLLIVDDEDAARYGMRRALSSFNYEIAEADSVKAARAELAARHADLLLLDVNLPGETGLDYLRELHTQKDAPLVVIITAHGNERMTVEAIKGGAYDYLSKPFEVDDLRLVVKNALETVKLRRENEHLRQRLELAAGQTGQLLGASPAMQNLRSLIEKIADTDATVLIRGESGTGKELVARAIHEGGRDNRRGAFVAINCAALPSELIESELFGHEKGAFTGAAARRQGKFEQANGGTLFLDEIGDMSANVQAKLLRALEERSIERLGGSQTIPVDVRVISATHRLLEQEIAAGNFRADLFYRLRVVTVELAPLRERCEDIPLLAESFAAAAAARYNRPARRIAPAALRRLMEYDYPGNVRELRNIIERAVVLAEDDELTAKDLPEEIKEKSRTQTTPASLNEAASEETAEELLRLPYTANLREDRREFERRYIARCLEETGGNVTRAASILGMHRQSLQHKLRELGLGRRYVSVESEKEDAASAAND